MICSMTASMYGKRWSAIIRIAERTVGKRKPIVYRGVRYNKNKREIVLADFESNIERKLKNPSVYADEDDIEYYGCSCYEKMEAIKKFANYPRKNYAIAKGIVKKSFGPICRNKSTTHINLFLFKDIDPSEYFKVVEE